MGRSRNDGKGIRAARLALASCALGFAALTAHAEGSTGSASAAPHIDFKIVIPVVLRVRAVSQAHELSVTREDAERGYVDVPAGTRLRVTSNDPAGLRVELRFDRERVSRVRAEMAGQQLEVASPESLPLRTAKMLDAPLDVGYRLYLVPGTAPGRYPWPVSLALGPDA